MSDSARREVTMSLAAVAVEVAAEAACARVSVTVRLARPPRAILTVKMRPRVHPVTVDR